jgi:membrane-bound ClpP family serine protease
MWNEIVILFQEMGWFPAVCLVLGLIMVIIEIFNPGFGFFGIFGVILLIIGIVVRVAESGTGNPLVQFLVLLLMIIGVIGVAFIVMVRSAKKGWLSRSPLVENKTAVPVGQTESSKNFNDLIGSLGVALTALRPSGTVVINDVEYDVVAAGFFIEKGEDVRVTMVEGNKIVVKKIN